MAFFSFGCEHTPEPLPSSYELDEMDLVPEGIAYSPSADKFYVSSVAKAKIIEVDRQTGAQRDFIGPKEFGYMPGVGILIDEPNDLLYALGGYFRLNDSLTSLVVSGKGEVSLLR